MKKESGKASGGGKKKLVWIIVIIIVILLVLAVVGYFIMKNKGISFGEVGLDFSSGTDAINNIEKATDTNSFDNMKLNPFEGESV